MGLLEDLAKKCNCLYISDLRYTVSESTIKKQLFSMDATDYSLHEWNDALQYLIGTNIMSLSQEGARYRLLNASPYISERERAKRSDCRRVYLRVKEATDKHEEEKD